VSCVLRGGDTRGNTAVYGPRFLFAYPSSINNDMDSCSNGLTPPPPIFFRGGDTRESTAVYGALSLSPDPSLSNDDMDSCSKCRISPG